MTLTKAFIVRARLIKKITEHLHNLPNPFGPEDNVKDFDASYDTLLLLRNSLTKLNTAIDEANAKGPRRILNAIESEKLNLKTVETVVQLMEEFKPEVKTYDPYEYNPDTKSNGRYVTTAQVLYTSKSKEDWANECERIKKHIEELEDALAEINAVTNVDWE